MNSETKPMRTVEEDEVEIDLVELFYYYLSKIKLIICALLAGALIVGLVTQFLVTPKYTATSKLYMVSASNDSVVDLTDLNLGTSLSLDYEVLMQIRPIAEDVIEGLDLDYTYEQLMDIVTISSIDQTRIIEVSVESTSPVEARDIANAMAEQAVTYLPDLMETSAPNIAEYAILPERQSSPSLIKNTLIGALAGMLLCIGVLTALFMMDDTLKSADDVEKTFGIMPLTVIPEGDLKELSEKTEQKQKRKSYRRKKKGSRQGGKRQDG